MFYHQTEDRLNSYALKQEEKLWRQKNNITTKKKGYICNKFLNWLLESYIKDSFDPQEKSKYEKVLWEAVDLITRKMMTTGVYLKKSKYIKEEMYGSAMLKVVQNIKKYDGRSSAFNFFSAIISSSFKDVIRLEAKQQDIRGVMKKEVSTRAEKRYSEVSSEKESIMNSEISQTNRKQNLTTKDPKSEMDLPIQEMDNVIYSDMIKIKEVPTIPFISGKDGDESFYKEFKEMVELEIGNITGELPKISYESIRLLIQPNLPIFMRKYKEFSRAMVINLNTTSLDLKKVMDLKDKEKKSIIVVEFLDLSVVNEQNGQHKNTLKDRIIRVRNNGFQYFGVYSDDWVGVDQEVKEYFVGLFVEMYLESVGIYSNEINKKKFSLAWDYIPPKTYQKHYKESHISDTYYGLMKERDKRYLILPGIEHYMEWLKADSNNTRVWDFGILDLRLKKNG